MGPGSAVILCVSPCCVWDFFVLKRLRSRLQFAHRVDKPQLHCVSKFYGLLIVIMCMMYSKSSCLLKFIIPALLPCLGDSCAILVGIGPLFSSGVLLNTSMVNLAYMICLLIYCSDRAKVVSALLVAWLLSMRGRLDNIPSWSYHGNWSSSLWRMSVDATNFKHSCTAAMPLLDSWKLSCAILIKQEDYCLITRVIFLIGLV